MKKGPEFGHVIHVGFVPVDSGILSGGMSSPQPVHPPQSPDLGLKLVRLARNGINPGLFKMIFQYVLACCVKMY